jgi:hypothetical protein
VRGSDPDAALYWFARMLAGGEDPRYLARRITRMAIEDIGLADPQAQAVCLQAWQTYERLGSPEGELALAQAVIYLALAPKSNAAYTGLQGRAMALARKTGSEPPPKHILNAPTKLMKEQGYGAGYAYDHDAEDGFSGQNYFPDGHEAPGPLSAARARLRTRVEEASGVFREAARAPARPERLTSAMRPRNGRAHDWERWHRWQLAGRWARWRVSPRNRFLSGFSAPAFRWARWLVNVVGSACPADRSCDVARYCARQSCRGFPGRLDSFSTNAMDTLHLWEAAWARWPMSGGARCSA